MLDFLGIGAQKTGTTWLYEMLRQHPQLSFPGGKEMHFWNAHRSLGVDWYLSHFNDAGKKNGEITPAYAMLPIETIQEIRTINPNLRLTYTLRNPIERAWSSARMALNRAEMEPDEASDQWFMDHFNSRGSLGRGDYERCIRNWRSVFGEEQLQILRYEDIVNRPRTLLQSCCRHFCIDANWANELPEETISKQVFVGNKSPIRPSLLKFLLHLYQPRVDSLAEYLHLDLNSWLMAPDECEDRSVR